MRPVACALLLLCACPGKAAPPAPRAAEADEAPKTITLSVVATNDVHGHVEQLPLFGGFLGNLRKARARDHGALLLLDAGDMLQGTLESNLSEGAATVRAFNALGCAAASVGNHEFDFGPVGPHPVVLANEDNPLGALEARAREAHFPWLSSNLARKDGQTPAVPGVVPSALLEIAGVHVGVIGGITKDALTQTQSANVTELVVTPLAESVAREAKSLRARGAGVVIAVVHAGGECHDLRNPEALASCDDKAEVFALARALSPKDVDLIVAGHTHEGVAHRVNGIPIIESFSNGRAFGRVDLYVETRSGKAGSLRIYPPQALCAEQLDKPACAGESYEGAPVARDAAVLQVLAPDLERARAERQRPLDVELTSEFKRSHKTESALGNLVADLVRGAYPGADAAINNGGSVRTGLPAGPLRYGLLFEMFPFDNAVAELRVSAAELAQIIAANLQSDRGFLALSGLRASARCAGHALTVELSRAKGAPLAPKTRLRVLTSDFLANGGDGLLRGIPLAKDAITIHRERMLRDAFVEELSARKGKLDGSDKALFDPAHPRVRYDGVRPLHCP
jgi:5'-nucleotidase